MSLFSKENKAAFTNPLNLDNPILVQVLGICSALAVTSQLKPAIVMGLAVTVITAFANVIISIIRNTIPNRIRIIVQLVVVAALVTIVSQILKAFVYDVSVELSVYVLRRSPCRTSHGLRSSMVWATVLVMPISSLLWVACASCLVVAHCSASRLFLREYMMQATSTMV